MTAYSALIDSELTQLLQTDDIQAFNELYHRYKVRIYGNLIKLCKSEEIAEELLQEVFIKIWDKRDKLNSELSFRSYLFRIAENQVADFFRKASRDKKLHAQLMEVATELYSHIEEDLFHKENGAMLDKAIEQLPPQRRKVFTLCKLEGKSYEETAAILGISTSTVHDHIVKGTRSVREHILSSSNLAVMLIVSAVLKDIL